MNQLVSVVIPVYNRQNLLAETLDSVLAQTYQNWECILVDDGSTDGSAKIIAQYQNKDSRFKSFKRPDDRNKGANACRNFGFEMSAGEFVNWFDSDDVLHPDFLRLKVEALQQQPQTDAVISKRAVFVSTPSEITEREQRTFLSNNTLEDFIMLKIAWYIQDGMWRKAFLEGKILFDEELLAGQDRDFHTRMLLAGPKLSIVDSYLAFNRKHTQTITSGINNTSDPRLKVSHLKSVVRLVEMLDKRQKLSDRLKVFLFASMIKYLPYVFKKRENFYILLRLLKKLTFASPAIVKSWARFWTAWAALKLTGKGERLLK